MAALKARSPRSGSGKTSPGGMLHGIQRALTWPARTRSYGIIVTLAMISLVVVALLHVWTRLEVIRIGYALSQQSRLHQALVQHNQRLRLELATRKDPAIVERIARERLQMVPPDPSGIRVLKLPTTPDPLQLKGHN
jgi:cell division protein FtsL